MTTVTPDPWLLPVPARKTSPPDIKSLSIQRDRLLDRLQGDRRRLTLIQGAAGAGKTLLAAQWGEELGHPVAWVTLDATDNDPVVLISSVMDALRRAGLNGSWEAGPLTSDEPTYSRNVLPHFQICLSSQAVPYTLVLDDAHEVNDSAAVPLLRSALESLPTAAHGVVVGRSLAQLPVATWLAGNDAVLLTEAALAMDPDEVAQMLTELGGATPDHQAVHDLLEATRGWPIAVYLGSQLGDPSRLGNLTYFSAFLDQEVLQGADAATVRLLKATSPLLDLSAELCDFVLRTQHSAEILERAEHASLLVTRSRDHDWFRLHPLLREHLQARLMAEDPSLYRTVARRASDWSMTMGHTDRAIAYARESGDTDLLGTMIWEGATHSLTTGQAQRVADWLATIDEVTIAGSCPLALTATWCSINRGRPADAYRWSLAAYSTAAEGWESKLQRTEPDSVPGQDPTAPRPGKSEPPRASIEAGLALLLGTTGSRGYQHSAVLASQALESLPGDHTVVPFAQMLTGWMQVLAGTWDLGIDNLGRSVQLAHSRGHLGTEGEAKALLSIALLSRGDVTTAESLVRQALDAWEKGGISHFLATGAMVAGPAALVAARAGQVELARVQLAHVRESMTMFGPILPWLTVILEALAAASYALLGDQQQAGRHLAGAAELMNKAPDSKLLANLVAVARDIVDSESQLSVLSLAERRVFERLLTRATLREIAEGLFVSPETIKSQTGSIYRKLGVASRREVQELGDRLWVDRAPRGL